MSEIVTGILIAVVAGVLLSWFGFNKHTTVIHVGSKHTSKKWKVFILIGWILIFFGGYYGLAWGVENGFSDYRTGLGLSLLIIGIPILLFGRFGAWWNRDYSLLKANDRTISA